LKRRHDLVPNLVAVDTVPTTFVAWLTSFERRPYLTAAESDRAVPHVDLTPGQPAALRVSSK
jgi:hypothetical protein